MVLPFYFTIVCLKLLYNRLENLFFQAHVSQSKKKLEKTFQEYKDLMVNIQDCLKFINEGLEQLKQHDLYVLSEARKDSVKIAKMVQLAATGRASARAIEANSNASGLIEGFALGMDLVIQGKNGQRPKKDFKSALGKKIRKLAEELNKGLDELKDLFSEHCSEVWKVFNLLTFSYLI